jgi:isopentenyl-diphosphate delta-isomerase
VSEGRAPDVEYVVLLAEDGQPCGTAPKAQVHHRNTPLHLAFSCWILDEQGRTLLTRRAASKQTWPGVWTNSFCGHPAPGESLVDAVHRRAAHELGVTVGTPAPALPHFRYRAVMADGIVENEVCPVFTAALLTEPEPNPTEVDAMRWVDLAKLADTVERDPTPYSPWMCEQLAALYPVLGASTTP